ncbi:MAG: hypothetical protein KatS3mg131_1588 [Candidatus Tectimicrobiota bacterium]|nr:MAG: hypothetical protein KatS3mg131_1588 [Candidatus Tectomicrobia bacterium]
MAGSAARRSRAPERRRGLSCCRLAQPERRQRVPGMPHAPTPPPHAAPGRLDNFRQFLGPGNLLEGQDLRRGRTPLGGGREAHPGERRLTRSDPPFSNAAIDAAGPVVKGHSTCPHWLSLRRGAHCLTPCGAPSGALERLAQVVIKEAARRAQEAPVRGDPCAAGWQTRGVPPFLRVGFMPGEEPCRATVRETTGQRWRPGCPPGCPVPILASG